MRANRARAIRACSLAKPIMMKMKVAKVRKYDTLDLAILASSRARADATRAMAESSDKVEGFFRGHHDDQIKARALTVHANRVRRYYLQPRRRVRWRAQ